MANPATVSSQDNGQQSPGYSREIRLGLVMYGGVSLAIYINGVAREFYRAVRGESAYKLLKALTDSDIVVDIMSGTSAGGVNGLLLGYALANKADFATTAALWREAGDLGALMQDPGSASPWSVLDGEGYYQQRLEGAFAAMDKAGARLRDARGNWLRDDIDPSPVSEMDVFITSTDVDGKRYTWLDAQGHPVDVKDHRCAFQLKYRMDRSRVRKNDFSHELGSRKASAGDHRRALAKLCRMTSCFPVAFPPVRVVAPQETWSPEQRQWRETFTTEDDVRYVKEWAGPDTLVATWGNLSKVESYFLDGGVLDNKPFTHTIKTIFYRLADRDVERKLFYVDPDPESFNHATRATHVNVLQAAQRALMSIPGYESIADDLKLLSAHNERVRRYWRLMGRSVAGVASRTRELLPSGDFDLGGDSAGAQSLEGLLDGAAIDPGSKQFILLMRDMEEQRPPDDADIPESRYARARFVTLSERAVQGIVKVDGEEVQLSADAKAKATALFKAFDDWGSADAEAGGAKAPKSIPYGAYTLYNFDVYFRLRRLFHVLYALAAPGIPDSDSDQLRQRAMAGIGRQITMLEVVRNAMERLVDEHEFHWKDRSPADVWMEVLGAFQGLLSPDSLPSGHEAVVEFADVFPPEWNDTDISETHARLKARLAGIKGGTAMAPLQQDVWEYRGLLAHTDAAERSLLGAYDRLADRLPDRAGMPVLLDIYRGFIVSDAELYTLDMFADLGEKDVIDTVRISPRDARLGLSDRDLAEKVAGDALFHFGGFLKKSWRANDIMWGRLDTTCQLFETLLDPKRIDAVMAVTSKRQAIAGRLDGGDLDPARLFARSSAEQQQKITAWLRDITSNDPAVRQQALGLDPGNASAKTDSTGYLGTVVQAAQMEFLGEELKTVLHDAVSEQMDWNLYRPTAGRLDDLAAGAIRPTGEFELGKGRFDPTTHAMAAEALSERALERLDSPASLERFFKDRYAVGRETLSRDIPIWVSMELLFRALLVLKKCVDHAVPSGIVSTIWSTLPFRLMEAVLWVLYGLTTTLRRSSRILLVARWVLATVAVVGLAIGGLLWSQGGFAGTGPSRLAASLMLLPTPLALLTFRGTRGLGIVLGITFAMAIAALPLIWRSIA